MGYTIHFLEELLVAYRDEFPRMSELKAFDEISARSAALANLSVCYHRESGFVGHRIKAELAGDMEFQCPASEYDRLLLIFKNGLYKVISVPDTLISFVSSLSTK